MKKVPRLVSDFVVRYLILILVAIPNLWLFYLIFTPLTIQVTYFLLGLFFKVSLLNNIIVVADNFPIQLVKACVAGSAYYLLLILNLSTPNIKIKKRLKMIFFAFLSLFIINILRIFILSVLFVKGTSFFDIAHMLFWYLGSVVFVILIWFIEVKVYKIKQIPFFSDLKSMFKKIKKH